MNNNVKEGKHILSPDIYDMFTHYNVNFQYKWNKIITAKFNAFADELHKITQQHGLSQTQKDQRVLWKNVNGQIEAMFSFIIDPTDIDSIISTSTLMICACLANAQQGQRIQL